MNRLLTKSAATMLALLLVLTASVQVRAQETSNQAGAAPAATGPDTETQTIENPPLSGLDAPSFEPGFGARSYLLPKLQSMRQWTRTGPEHWATAQLLKASLAAWVR